jgi:fumarate reductase subunit C
MTGGWDEGSMKTREYIRPMPATWWLHNRQLFMFMLRELSSVFVAGYAVFLIVLLFRFGQGREAFHEFFEALRSPASILLHLVALAFVVYHSVTSFNAAPVIMTVWRGEEKVEPALIVGGNYALWLILSVLVWAAALWLPL